MHFEVRAKIQATPAKLWSVLTDPGLMASGPFGILRLEGTIGLNEIIKLWSEASPKRAFRVKVIVFEPVRLMVWKGGLPLGLFQGVRNFVISPDGAGCQFVMREDYTGPLAGMIGKSIPDLNPSFQKFAAALKFTAEG